MDVSLQPRHSKQSSPGPRIQGFKGGREIRLRLHGRDTVGALSVCLGEVGHEEDRDRTHGKLSGD